jgi:predicted Ser/Thr protein kinase
VTDKFAAKSLVGGKLGQFEIRSEIARGGMGVVYKGYQPSLDRWVAIKTLPTDLAADRDLVARFQREAEAMVRLNHANIVQIIDRGQEAGQYYFAMEFVEGPSVKDLLKSETIETDKLFDIVLQTCDGLEYAHKKGLVHRDVKPANLLYEERTGVVKIADFGIAHFSKKDDDMLTLTAQNVGMGTMNYMSPEQKVDAGSVDHRADIYALGVIVYEAFTGKLPLGKFKMPSQVNPKLPRTLDKVVQRCMETDALERYASCAELKVDLLAAKAETHEKTLSRKVREAIDFTVTAFKTRRTLAVSVLGCAGLVAASAVVGLVLLLRAGDRKKYESTRAAVTAAQTRLAALLVGGAAGTDEQTAASKLLAEAEGEAAPALKLEKLGSALERYQRGIEAAVHWRNDKAAEVRVSAARIRAAVSTLADDGLKALATRKLDEAEKAASAPETLDPKAAGDSIADADRAASVATLIAQQESAVRSKLESAPADDPNRKKGEEALKRAADARSAGDAALALAAFKVADESSALATKSAPQVKDPTPVIPPANQPDPALVRAYEAARAKAQEAGDELGKIVGEAKAIGVPEGGDELKAGSDLEAEAAGLAAKDPAAATKKLDDAAAAIASGQKKALLALRALVIVHKDDAEVAQTYAPDDYAAADAIDHQTSNLTGAALAERLVKAQAAFAAAADKARVPAEARWKKLLAAAERSRTLADARLEGGDKAPLAAADEALERAKKPHDQNLATALREIDVALKAFDAVDSSCPKLATLGTASAGTKLGSDLGFKDRLDGVAACSKGFVLAARTDLRCFSPVFGKAATNAVAPAFVMAVATGDGDDFYAALASKKIVRYVVGNEIELADPLPGGLSELPNPALAIAYDRVRKFVYVASEDEVSVYSVETGKAPRPPIDLRGSGIVRALSMAVLTDGSVVVSGHGSPTTEPESRWRFAARQWSWDETAGWQSKGARDDGLCSVAAVGENLVGLFHGEKGRLVVWAKGVPLGDAPAEILTDSREGAYPNDGLRLSVFGHHAYVLDLPLVIEKYSYRKRVRVFDLKD